MEELNLTAQRQVSGGCASIYGFSILTISIGVGIYHLVKKYRLSITRIM